MRKMIAFVSFFLLASSLVFSQLYQATPLQSLGKGSPHNGLTVALGINDSGIVVGTSQLLNKSRHACYWSQNGAVKDLGTLGGTYGVGFAINNLTQVVGAASLAGDTSDHPFLWSSTEGMQDLGHLGVGWQSGANALNDKTQVVGFSCLDNNGTCHAFLWTSAAGMQDLGTLGGAFSNALGINEAGHVVGSAARADGTQHAFIWTVAEGMQELEPGSSFESSAAAINKSDQVVGYFISPADNQSHGFIWSQATGLKDLGTLGTGWSEALGINDSGDVVGFARNATLTGFVIIWRQGGTIQKLTPLAGVTLNESATGINTSGQISANGGKPNLLTPTWVKFSSKKLNFGSWPVGQTSTTKTVTLTNIGSTPLTIAGITIMGANSGDFAQVNTCGSSVAAKAKCLIHVTFTPSATGIRNGFINIADSDRTSPQKIALTGTGI